MGFLNSNPHWRGHCVGSISYKMKREYFIFSKELFNCENIKYALFNLGVKVRNIKMDFNTRGTWRWVWQWTLMMKII